MVKSRPMPTPRPGWTRVPTCRTRMLPGSTRSPPKTLIPRCCPGESRPLREEPCPFLCAMCFPSPSLSGDSGDPELGVGLPVAADAVPALFLGPEVPQLAVLAVRDDLGLDLGAADRRRPDLDPRPFAARQRLERHGRADRLLQFLHLEQIALLDAVLLAARADHCVHRTAPWLFRLVHQPGWQGDSRRLARKRARDLARVAAVCQGKLSGSRLVARPGHPPRGHDSGGRGGRRPSAGPG